MIPVVLGLGANKKLSSTISENEFYHPATTLKKAFSVLKNVLSNSVMSSIYKTKAMYVTDQDDFYNAAVFGYYNGEPEDLLIQLQGIEALFGRNREKEIRNGPRTLDIDIELFGNQKINTKKLEIPHPRLHERQFILIPLLDVLKVSADIPNRSVFENYLKQLPNQGVELYERIEY